MSEQQLSMDTDSAGAAGEVEDQDTPELVQEDDEPLAAHGESGWIAPFVAWAREETDTLDFGGASVPNRVRDLLGDREVANAGAHEDSDPTPAQEAAQ